MQLRDGQPFLGSHEGLQTGVEGTCWPWSALPFTVNTNMPTRLLGLFLLTLAIVIPSCQAVFPADGAGALQPFRPGFVRE